MLAMKPFSALALALAFISSVGAASAQPVYVPYQQPQVLPPQPSAQHPQAQHPQAQHPQAQHPQAQHPQAQHPQAQHPQAQHPQAQHPQAQHPQAPSPHAQKPHAQPPQPQVQAPRHPQPQIQQPRPPAVGDRPREARPFHHADSTRFRAPPRGQEYRVVDGYVVLVDSRTLQIVNVLGLLSALIR